MSYDSVKFRADVRVAVEDAIERELKPLVEQSTRRMMVLQVLIATVPNDLWSAEAVRGAAKRVDYLLGYIE